MKPASPAATSPTPRSKPSPCSTRSSLEAAQSGTLEDRIRLAFRRLLSRPPAAEETALLARFFTAQKARFTTGELDPKTLAPEGSGDPADRAHAIFNLDEAVTRS